MALHAVQTSDLLNIHRIDLSGFQLFVQFLIGGVVFVIGKIHIGIAVALYAPSHREVGELPHDVHLFNRAVAGFALYLAGIHMLGMAEENMLLQVVDSDPLNRFAGVLCPEYLVDFEFSGVAALFYHFVAGQAHIIRRDSGRFAVVGNVVAVAAVGFVVAGVYLVREFDGLVRSVVLSAGGGSALPPWQC